MRHVDQLSFPPEIQFPFRQGLEHQDVVRARAEKVMLGIRDMVLDIANRRAPKGSDEDWIQDSAQACLIFLYEISLPKYDAWRKPAVKVSTFLHSCARNFMTDLIRSQHRQSRQRISTRGAVDWGDPVDSKDTRLDRKIEDLAESIMCTPEKYLTPSQAAIFKAIIEAQGSTLSMKELAKKLNYKRPSSLSMVMRRIRERIEQISIEDHSFVEDEDA